MDAYRPDCLLEDLASLPVTTIRTADGSHTLHSERYGETFHSINGAVTESRHVFLNASGVAERLAAGQATRVLEIGFGLGLNCLLTADLASECQAPLEYHAIENDPSVLALLPTVHYQEQLKDSRLYDQLIAGLDSVAYLRDGDMGTRAPLTLVLGKNITLTLHLCDAIHDELPAGEFDAIYLDAFSPDSNPECWTPEFFSRLHGKTSKGGALTTYSAKGDVRRALKAAGYNVNKMAGPPGKREMLHAAC